MKRTNFQLTPHFSYDEMTFSAWAETHNADNTPDCLQQAALENLCRKFMEPLYAKFGPVTVRSAFRTEQVNIGHHGVGCSKHLSGEAVDISLPDEQTGRAYFRFLKTLPDIDQIFFEYDRHGDMWLHLSSCLDARENRHQLFPNYRMTYDEDL